MDIWVCSSEERSGLKTYVWDLLMEDGIQCHGPEWDHPESEDEQRRRVQTEPRASLMCGGQGERQRDLKRTSNGAWEGTASLSGRRKTRSQVRIVPAVSNVVRE